MSRQGPLIGKKELWTVNWYWVIIGCEYRFIAIQNYKYIINLLLRIVQHISDIIFEMEQINW